MMGRFKANQTLVDLSLKMNASSTTLEKASASYEDSKRAIIEARVGVRYIDFVSDGEMRQLIRRAELADGKANGPIYGILAPEGVTPLVKPFGQKQVDALKDLEGRLGAAAAVWPDALTEQVQVKKMREDYETALKLRDVAWQAAKDLRAVRNVTRDQFVTDYVDATLKVKQLFPRDTRMQELFFDDVEKDQNEPEVDVATPGATGTAAGTTGTTAGTTGV